MNIHWLFGILSLVLATGCSNQPAKENENKEHLETDSLTAAKKQKIQDFWTYYRLATRKRIAGSWQEAIEGYSAALKLKADHEDARYYLANMYLESREWVKAEENWNKLLELNPSSSRACYQLGKLYFNPQAVELFDLEKAAGQFQKTSDINQDFLQPILHLAQIALVRGDYSESKEKLRIVLGSDYKNIEAWFLMGFIDYKNGSVTEAGNNFIKARDFFIQKNEPSGIKGEGDTKTGRSLERAINQSIFSAYLACFESEKSKSITNEMQACYSSLNDYIIQLRNL
jgi:tetratricopeptide (TPR) repeat protein